MGPAGTGVDLCAPAHERLQGVSHSSSQPISSFPRVSFQSKALFINDQCGSDLLQGKYKNHAGALLAFPDK